MTQSALWMWRLPSGRVGRGVWRGARQNNRAAGEPVAAWGWGVERRNGLIGDREGGRAMKERKPGLQEPDGKRRRRLSKDARKACGQAWRRGSVDAGDALTDWKGRRDAPEKAGRTGER